MDDVLWYLTRATGIVASLLIATAVISGFLFSGRETGNRRRPNWWLDLNYSLGVRAFGLVMPAQRQDSGQTLR